MIYITGDTHGDVTRFSMDNFPEQKTFTDQNENGEYEDYAWIGLELFSRNTFREVLA